jgi:hypothetical protein
MIKKRSTDLVQDYIDCKSARSEYITVPYNRFRITWYDSWWLQKLALHINKVGELCKAGGLLAYHNHDFEFKIWVTNGYWDFIKWN